MAESIDKQLDQALEHVAVLGAAGKMGSGISLLLLQEMARLELEKKGTIGSGANVLKLIDSNERSFPQLRNYLRDQLLKYAEKNINYLRKCFSKNPELISNEEIIQAYVEGCLDIVIFTDEAQAAKNTKLIFEAIIEDMDLKAQVLKGIVEAGNKGGLFFSNTSSIPIGDLSEKAGLQGRLIGFHFYNPPAVQKLLEIIVPEKIHPNLIEMATELAKRLKKIVVYSRDVAGFIGNGHFIREVAFACKKAEELSHKYPLAEAIYMINQVTADWLIRPMGIFQLMDYVGLDVCQHISQVMFSYLKDPSLNGELVDQMVARGILGGQYPNGTQKNGFFSYEKTHINGIFSISELTYVPLKESPWFSEVEKNLGPLPRNHRPWKLMQKEPQTFLEDYLENLKAENSLGSHLAQEFLDHSRSISKKLIEEKIASSEQDMHTVLTNGFYHLYG